MSRPGAPAVRHPVRVRSPRRLTRLFACATWLSLAASSAALAQAPTEPPAVAEQLTQVYGAIEEFQRIQVAAEGGVVHLSGEVPTSAAHDQAVELARGTEGVVFVDDDLTEPVAIGDRLTPVRERVERWIVGLIDKLPVLLVAIALLAAFVLAGRFLASRERLMSRLVKRRMLRDLVERMIRVGFIAIGVILALELLDATAVVGAALGAAGVVGIALGFAFRDIAENYLASLLLVARRPFALGDAVKIGEHEGKVVTLTMRETTLMTFDGNHLSLPNAEVFKASVLNYSRNPKRRYDFAVGAGVDTDLVAAQRLGVETLGSTPGTLADPAPFAVIEQLGDSNVALRFHAWIDQRETDYLKARSEGIRRVKTALEAAGVDMPEPIYRVLVSNRDAAAASDSGQRAVDAGPIDNPHADVGADDSLDRQIAETQAESDEANLLEGAA